MKKKIPLLLLLLLIFISYGLRIWRLSEPPKYYFDEVYHAFTAIAYANNDPKGYEWWHQAPEGVAYEWLHPPISKLIMGMSISILGENSFAWRFPSVIFGLLVIVATYWLAQVLTKNKNIALLAAFLVSLDGLLLVQSRIAMNDIYVTFFIIMALGFYWQSTQTKKKTKSRKFLLLSAIFTGLSVATKWSGIFILPIVGLWELIRVIRSPKQNFTLILLSVTSFVYLPLSSLFLLSKKTINLIGVIDTHSFALMLLTISALLIAKHLGFLRFAQLFLSFLVIPFAIYLMSYSQFFLQGHTTGQLIELHKQIWWYQTNLDAHHNYESRPWQWALDLRPVWYHVDYISDSKIANIYALGNPVLAWFGLLGINLLAIAAIVTGNLVWLFVLISYCLVWMPWFASPRIMFYYHYAPAIPWLAVSLAVVLNKIWRFGRIGKGTTIFICLLILACFCWLYPHWTGLALPKTFVDHYYLFDSWK